MVSGLSNALKTTLLLGVLTGLLLWIGQVLGGSQGLAVALVVAAAMNLGSYWFSDRIVLAMYGARELSEGDAPELFRIVRELAAGGHMAMPRVYLIPSDAPNAFATGRSPAHAAVAVTEGIMRLLDAEELRGVLAHELSHVRNRDTLISAIAATLAGVVMMLARMAYWAELFGGMRRDDREEGGLFGALAMMIVAPIAASLIQLAISRAREYEADASGARLSHAPLALASALEKIATATGRFPLPAGPATAHLWIVNPLRGDRLANLFSTHPPIEERIHRLRAMAH
ncbi:MAG TPA: zinc metalloprotease HtpX [Candidatus Binatia bacterium]|nr:zinc metalloprotease HtpX [Candidatus Binatia bacterium]